jgi:hypothetical protein
MSYRHSKALQVISLHGEQLDMACAHSNLDRFSSCRKRALQGAILNRGHAKDTGRDERQCQDKGQHDAAQMLHFSTKLTKGCSPHIQAGGRRSCHEPRGTRSLC